MTTAVFSEWFEAFTNTVTEHPMLLTFGGHLAHQSIEVIEKANAESVISLKLPPHTTDLLQTLDVACFGPMKQMWSKALNDWVSEYGALEPIGELQFVNLLGEIWHKGLSTENIKSGFETVGIFPEDSSK